MHVCDSLLPVSNHRNEIVAALSSKRCVIVSSPPGSGKSTCVPRFFADHPDIPGRILVLQPRRLAARHLAAYCARLSGEVVGETVGYQVRFDTAVGPRTRIVFQTYGVFVRQLLDNPSMEGVGMVVLDEFHERTLEADLALAWIRTVRERSRRGPALVVMSATLAGDALARYMGGAPLVEAKGRVFPVEISRQAPKPFEKPEQQAVRCVQMRLQGEPDGSFLIFMPGTAEIRRTTELLEPICRRAALPVFALHSRLGLDEQLGVLDEAAKRPVVIVSTNVAETSLTIPGVTTVIDCGYERRAAYDPGRRRNTLYQALISRGSATQRAGRAGRTVPGRCIQLWPEQTDAAMPESVAPEIARLELSSTALTALTLCRRAGLAPQSALVLDWLTPPEPERWKQAIDTLERLGATRSEHSVPTLLDFGDQLARWPTDPLPAAILEASTRAGVSLLSCAAIAIWENEEGKGVHADVLDAALTLAQDRHDRDISPDVRRAYDALCRMCDRRELERERAELGTATTADRISRLRRRMCTCWLKLLTERIAVREPDGGRYVLADGTGVRIETPRALTYTTPEAIIALSTLETGGAGRNRTTLAPQFVPLETAWLEEVFADRLTLESECRWDSTSRAVVAEERTMMGTLIVRRESVPGAASDASATADILVDRILGGDIALLDDQTRQLAFRIACVARAMPERSIPSLDGDGWRRIYRAHAHGKSSASELEKSDIVPHIMAYAGLSSQDLDRLAPTRIKLSSGRAGRVAYFESTPPELSARIGDLIGIRGPFTVCQGRVRGVYDILAPNMRTVQKTADLDGFWSRAYPEIRNELRRRYPRHPWP